MALPLDIVYENLKTKRRKKKRRNGNLNKKPIKEEPSAEAKERDSWLRKNKNRCECDD